jgi:hypothetical protein
MVKRWKDDQKAVVVVTHQDSKMAKVIRESHRNVRYKYDANGLWQKLEALSLSRSG